MIASASDNFLLLGFKSEYCIICSNFTHEGKSAYMKLSRADVWARAEISWIWDWRNVSIRSFNTVVVFFYMTSICCHDILRNSPNDIVSEIEISITLLFSLLFFLWWRKVQLFLQPLWHQNLIKQQFHAFCKDCSELSLLLIFLLSPLIHIYCIGFSPSFSQSKKVSWTSCMNVSFL